MKRFTLLLAFISLSVCQIFSQANLVVEAPMNDNTGGINRGPNGTALHAFLRGCYLVPQSELGNIPAGTSLTSFGFTMIVGATGSPVSGNITVYLQNTNDLSYLKGTSWPTAITGMTTAYASVMTVPVSAVTTSVSVTLSTPVTYTGGGMYVAYDWSSAGPFNTAAANYLGETTAFPLPAGGGANFFSATSEPATMTLTNSRPAFLFGFTNPFTNDIRVWGIEAPGKVVSPLNTAHNIKAQIRNAGSATQNNISVFLNVTGANIFSTSHTIPSLAAGQTTLVTFSAFNPLTNGTNLIAVSTASDQYNGNNSLTYQQEVNCTTWAQNPSTGTYTNGAGFATGSGIIATTYSNPVNSSLVGINLALSADPLNVGQQLYGVLMNSTGVILATTNTLTITTPMLGTLQTFSFSPAQSLSSATMYNIGIAQLNPTPVAFRPFAYRSSYYTSSTLYSYTGITAGALFPLVQNFGYFGIEAVLGNMSSNLVISSTPPVVCAGLCATLTAPQGISNYTWSTGATGPSITACPTQIASSYSVMGTSTLNCPAMATVSLGINPLPNIGIASTSNSVCIGFPVTFTANGANTYSLNNAATAAAISVTPQVSTNYTITGMDANGCVNTASIDISVVSLTVTVTSNTSICKGRQVTLTASGPGAYLYNWTSGALSFPFSSATDNPQVTTTYTWLATDGNCSLSNTVLVTVNPNPTVVATSAKPTICKGEQVVITATGASTYSWSNNSAAASITVSPVANTNYIVSGTNTAGCTHSVVIAQSVNPCTAISENKRQDQVTSVFPNPNNGSFYVQLHGIGTARLDVYNALGALIKSEQLSEETSSIDLGGEAKGIYFLQVSKDNRLVSSHKIIKQ